MKYVRSEEEGFLLSPQGLESIAHARVARLFRSPIVSAGFVRFSNWKPRCYGQSESLRIGSLPEDSDLLAEQLGIEQ